MKNDQNLKPSAVSMKSSSRGAEVSLFLVSPTTVKEMVESTSRCGVPATLVRRSASADAPSTCRYSQTSPISFVMRLPTGLALVRIAVLFVTGSENHCCTT